MVRTAVFLACALAFGATATANAAPPANDAFADAIGLAPSFSTSATGSNVEATKESGEPNHAGNLGGASIWYSWTAPSDGRLTLDTEGSVTDTLLAVYTGVGVGGLTEVGSNDDVGGTIPPVWSRVTVPVVSGQQYWIAVDGSASSNGSITLTLSQIAIPLNDNFGSPDNLALPDTFNISNIAALKELGEPDHAGDPGRASLWFKVTPASSGQIGIDTFGSGFDTLIGVYTGSAVGSLTEVAANNDVAGGVESRVVFSATAGTTYYVALDGKDGATGTFTVHSDFVPPNDDFADAEAVTGPLPARLPGSNYVATGEVGEPDHDDADPGGASIWYTWTPDASGTVTIDTFDSDPGFDSVLAVYTGSAVGALTPVASNDEATGIACCQSMVQFFATAGTTYKIAIDGYRGAQSSAAVGTTLLTVAWKPANDDLAGATALTATGATASATGSNFGATKEVGEPQHAASGGRSRWYIWTAPATGSATIETTAADFDTLLGVYTDGVYPLTPVAANDDASGSTSLSSVTFSATASVEYRIAVDGRLGSGGDFTVRAVQGLSVETPTEGGFVNPTVGSVSFTAGPDIISVTCQLDSGPVDPCTSPWSYPPGLTDGTSHTVTLVATDGTGPQTPVVRNFTVDTTKPNLPGLGIKPPSITSSTTATFEFSKNALDATDPTITFECVLDGPPYVYVPCASPLTYTGLSAGAHAFLVRAVDGAGNRSTASAAANWTIDPGYMPPVTSPADPPASAPATPPPATSPPPADVTAPTVALKILSKLSIKLVTKKGLAVEAACRERAVVKIDILVDAKTAAKLKLGKKPVKIGSGAVALNKPGSARIKVKLTATAKRALKRAKKIAATMRTTATDAAGNRGVNLRKISLKK